jgi:hypothetical protein
MGVDISGKNPIIRSEKPQFPSNEVWKEMSEDARDEFWQLDREFKENNPGDYFRSNWWGWRPIVMLSEMVNDMRDLSLDLSYWGSNDGRGLDTQEECNKLADALEEICKEFFDVEDVDELQLCMGSWVTLDGKFATSKVEEDLNEEYHGQLITSPIVTKDGMVVKSAHSIDKSHLQRFISFLRECGGFEIW